MMMQSKMLLVLGCAGLAAASSSDYGVWAYDKAVCDGNTQYAADGEMHNNCGSGATQVKTGKCKQLGGSYECWIEQCSTAKAATTDGDSEDEICDKNIHGAVIKGQEINPNPSSPTSSMRSTRITDPMRGFKDMPDSRFLKFPQTMVGRDALVPSVRTKAGYDVTLECVAPHGGAGGYCDHFVVLYSCPPCEHADGGNLPAVLLADGWVPHRCGTVMDLDANLPSHLHQLVIYHKQTLAGPPLAPGSDSIVPTELLEFAFYANTPATSYCPNILGEAACNNHLPAECAWKDGTCVANLCPKKPTPAKGPWPTESKCSVCPFSDSEKIFIPALKI